MNTENTKNSLADIRSLIGDFLAPTPAPVFSVLQLGRIRARCEDFSQSAAVGAEHQPQPVAARGRR